MDAMQPDSESSEQRPDSEGAGDSVSPGFAASVAPAPARRERKRKSAMRIDERTIAQRVVDFFDEDDTNRAMDLDARLQRYAKFRMWTEGKDWPWEDASDAALPDMMTHSLKVQDTLHNAVMSRRPAVVSKAVNKANKGKQDTVDGLLDFQFFVENPGEHIAGEMADAFVNDGTMVVFTPWVKEERETHTIHTLPPIPITNTPEQYFASYLAGVYKAKIFKKKDNDGWSWEVLEDGDTWFDVEFYTVGKQIEMDAQKKTVVFDGPRPIVKDYEDVLAPVRAANLQIPSPSNPGGASHVILVDYPTIDEVKRLQASGFYDLLSDEDLKKLDRVQMDTTVGETVKQQSDAFQGQQNTQSANDGAGEGKSPDHNTITRLTCFDIYDSDGDGVNEDMIWWVLKEPKLLVRARELTQVYPSNPPRRPLAEATFLPVRGRRIGISLLEIIEGLHDLMKQFLDQTVDRATLTGVPFGFYRASGNMRPETIRMWPGELYPLADPKNDVVFPQLPQQGGADGLNLIAMLGQMEERVTNIGDLQLGRVPSGKASALRTVRGMQSVMAQGDARPERILRRFFMGLKEVYAQMHELNQTWLPRDKQYRVCGVSKPDEDPYRSVSDPNQIRGRFQFDFDANAMNTSKEAIQGALDKLMTMYLNPLALQLGVVKADGVYQIMRDAGKALGQDPDKYLTAPSPDANLPKMFAEEVITLIMVGELPECRPAEPSAMDHMGKLMEFAGSDNFGYLTAAQVDIYKAYLTKLRQRMQAEAQQAAAQAAAAAFQQGQQGQGMPGPEGSAPIEAGQAPLQQNELMDESLPGAGGGGNPATIQ